MKPTTEQKQWLKDYLYKTMKYRETYEEVYDHMLLAIENHPEQQYFTTVVLEILEKDFGGNNGLLELEENCRQSVAAIAETQFRDSFKTWFLSPLALVTVAMFAGLFYLQFPYVKTGGALIFLFVALLVLPTIICSARAARLGYKYGESKTAIKDEVFRRLAFKSNRIILMFILISGGAQAIAKVVIWINEYLGLLLGVLVSLSLLWAVVRKYLLKTWNGAIIPLKEKTFLGWLSIVMLGSDLIAMSLAEIRQLPEHSPDPTSATTFAILYSIAAIVLTLMIINVLTTIKLYRSEFKTQIIKS